MGPLLGRALVRIPHTLWTSTLGDSAVTSGDLMGTCELQGERSLSKHIQGPSSGGPPANPASAGPTSQPRREPGRSVLGWSVSERWPGHPVQRSFLDPVPAGTRSEGRRAGAKWTSSGQAALADGRGEGRKTGEEREKGQAGWE